MHAVQTFGYGYMYCKYWGACTACAESNVVSTYTCDGDGLGDDRHVLQFLRQGENLIFVNMHHYSVELLWTTSLLSPYHTKSSIADFIDTYVLHFPAFGSCHIRHLKSENQLQLLCVYVLLVCFQQWSWLHWVITTDISSNNRCYKILLCQPKQFVDVIVQKAVCSLPPVIAICGWSDKLIQLKGLGSLCDGKLIQNCHCKFMHAWTFYANVCVCVCMRERREVWWWDFISEW